jgi:soluble lytic murein transglycosylase-like protein
MRFFGRLFSRLPLWQRLVALACLPLLAINGAVAFFGSSMVFPLSPFWLEEKVAALTRYAVHRPRCVFSGHDDLEPLVAQAERKYELPRGLMRAIVQTESGLRPHRISFAGAMGPAQLMPGTAAMLEVGDPFDPQQSVDAGARYLKQQLRRFGSVELAVAAYNAGPGAVRGAVPRNGETQAYVAKVMHAYRTHR